MRSTRDVGGRLGGVLASVRSLAAQSVAELPDAQVSAEVIALRELADAAEAAYLGRLAVFHARGLGQANGLSTRAWLRSKTNVAPGEATRAIKTATGLARLPGTAAALAEGAVRPGHAAAIVDAATMLGAEVVRDAEPTLIKAATHLDPTKLRIALRGYGAAVDNPAAVRAAEHRDENRWLDVATTIDGALAIQGVLGHEDGAIVTAAIGALTTPAGRDDSRTAAQRRADDLTQLCRHQLGCDQLPSHGGEPTHLTVITTLDTIQQHLTDHATGPSAASTGIAEGGSAARTGSPEPGDSGTAGGEPIANGGYGMLPDGSILRGETVRRMACDAKVTRLIVGPDSMPLDVGRSRRTVTPAQRKALRVRDSGCTFPGCDRPPEWCDAHHINFWSLGGRTDIAELTLLCRTHHTLIHEGHWRIHLTDPGRFHFITPHGEIIRPEPARASGALLARLLARNGDAPDAA